MLLTIEKEQCLQLITFGRVSRDVEMSSATFFRYLAVTQLGLMIYLASSLEFLLVPFVG